MTVCACVLFSTPARADLFSPGELIEPHAHLEGVSRCKACHPSGDELSGKLCLDCHTELAGQVSRGRGYHGRLQKAELDACQKCHRDHLGRKQPPTEWGPGGMKGFDHDAAGWPLEKGHAKLKCNECHQRELLVLPEVKAWVERYPTCRTLLGAPRACSACHFDEHRGGASQECERCHGADDWKKTPKYDHKRASAYPLLGKHRKLKCSECHPTAEDEKTPAGAWPKPLAMTYLKLAPIPHERCTTCHEDDDVHKGRYGARCEGCHSEASWKALKAGAMDRIDHDRYRYPLEGAHAQVACDACHGPWRGLLPKPKYKGIAFARCTDCHYDAHFGQLDKKTDCDACHTLQSFSPPTYGVKEHERARWKLEGAHRAVPCGACHADERSLAGHFDDRARAALKARGRPETYSLARLEFPRELDACETCHADVHQGQLGEQPCNGCHRTDTFRVADYDHSKTRFPLTGAHRDAACGACHPRQQAKGRQVTRYKPVETECATCHADGHATQFGKSPDCSRCHGDQSFEKAAKFRHRPPFTAYLLEGAHEPVPCARCHPEVEVGRGQKTRLYKPLPGRCAGCHVDLHDGAFAGFEP